MHSLIILTKSPSHILICEVSFLILILMCHLKSEESHFVKFVSIPIGKLLFIDFI